jgi:D-alanine-D-alanine ligase
MKNYDVAVLFGGISNENEISVITGTMVCNILKKGGKRVLPIYISQKGEMFSDGKLADIDTFKGDKYLFCPACAVANGGVIIFSKRGKIKERVEVECAINCCHGGSGEGGGACGLFALNNIPLASAKLFESAAFMDKYYTKMVLQSLGVKVAPYVYLRDMSGAIEKVKALGYPVIVKPAKLGSSIGIEKAENDEELICALETAFELDDGVILEKFLSPRREINCAAYMADDRVILSDCEEAITQGELLSYDDKYGGGGRSVFPAVLKENVSAQIKDTSHCVYSSLNMRGIVRFDFILSDDEVYLSEINTVPGSLSYYLLSSGFADFYGVLDGVITQAKADCERAGKKLLVNTGIINNFTSNACKIK